MPSSPKRSGQLSAIVDPTENVRELVILTERRLDDLRISEAKRVDERWTLTEKHRVELAAKDAEILRKESERINAVAAAEKARVDATFAEQRGAAALLQSSTDQKATALADRVSAAATAQVATTSANTARSGISTPLLMTLATLGGALTLYVIEKLIAVSPSVPVLVK